MRSTLQAPKKPSSTSQAGVRKRTHVLVFHVPIQGKEEEQPKGAYDQASDETQLGGGGTHGVRGVEGGLEWSGGGSQELSRRLTVVLNTSPTVFLFNCVFVVLFRKIVFVCL